jgi:IS66 Orf2 like protein
VALGATDMRKGFDGLYGIVRDRLGLEVRTGHLFLFANARRNRLKILYWDGYATLAIMGRFHGNHPMIEGTAKAAAGQDSHNRLPSTWMLEPRVTVVV